MVGSSERNNVFHGKLFCVVGFDGAPRKHLLSRIMNCGGSVSYLPSAQVNYVVSNINSLHPRPNSLIQTAIQRNIPIVGEAFIDHAEQLMDIPDPLIFSLIQIENDSGLRVSIPEACDDQLDTASSPFQHYSESQIYSSRSKPTHISSSPQPYSLELESRNLSKELPSNTSEGYNSEADLAHTAPNIFSRSYDILDKIDVPGFFEMHKFRIGASLEHVQYPFLSSFQPTEVTKSYIDPELPKASSKTTRITHPSSPEETTQALLSLQSITAMKDYSAYSFEELRYIYRLWDIGVPQAPLTCEDVDEYAENAQMVSEEHVVQESYLSSDLFEKHTGMVWAIGIGAQTGVGSRSRDLVVFESCKMWETDHMVLDDVSVMSASTSHSALVTKDGQLLTAGVGKTGRLGKGDTSRSIYFSPIRIGEGLIKIASVSCGAAFTIALGQNGGLYSFGKNRYGQLGLGDTETRFAPERVVIGSEYQVTQVSCGQDHVVAVDKNGRVLTWGRNNSGQCGFSVANNEIILRPEPMRHLIEQIAVACCGLDFSLLLSMNGKVYSMGSNIYGQLGQNQGKRSEKPIMVMFPDSSKIVQLSCGSQHAAALSKDGHLYTWGRSDKFQTGLKPAKSSHTPQLMDTIPGKIMHISCSGDNTGFVSDEWKAYFFGPSVAKWFNAQPSEMPTQFISNCKINSISLGDEHALLGVFSKQQQALQLARNGDTKELNKLIDGGISPNLQSEDGFGLLHYTVQYGREEAFNYLLSRGADPCLPIRRCLSGVEVLIQIERFSAAEVVTKTKTKKSRKSSKLSSQTAKAKTSVSLKTPLEGGTALHLAAALGKLVYISKLITVGDLNIQDSLGFTPLHWAVFYNRYEVIEFLLDNGVHKSLPSLDGRTALHLAIQDENWRVARLLARKAIDITVVDSQGKTALDYCSYSVSVELKMLASKHEVFISYAHMDSIVAKRVKEEIEARNVPCWMDAYRLEAGTDWRSEIGMAITSAKMVVFLQSASSMASESCQKEISIAHRSGLPICVLRIEAGEVPLRTSHILSKRRTFVLDEQASNRLSELSKYVLGRILRFRQSPYLARLSKRDDSKHQSSDADDDQQYLALLHLSEHSTTLKSISAALGQANLRVVDLLFEELCKQIRFQESEDVESSQLTDDLQHEYQKENATLSNSMAVVVVVDKRGFSSHQDKFITFLKLEGKKRFVFLKSLYIFLKKI
eukprot:TRINITY_DN7282_c0_g1_i5.p1 TRINITY_DN7282_c0_g1~~TRINITY_DN7282_c0_g1_i5.p1  ORF type:complete len:1210 (+),score=179.41 TRINITY_DN7282_c0_g1_i5:72-3701(+)